MRQLIYAINITLDGCCDHTKIIASRELHEYYTQAMQAADTLLYGRKTYELMVPFWPDTAKNQDGGDAATNAFAKAFDAVKNIVVVSNSLTQPEDTKTKVLRGYLREQLLQLKQQPGKNILLGGVDLASQLIALNLVDEYHILVQPTLAGAGRRLFTELNLQENISIKLMDTKVFESGSVLLRYNKL